MTDATPFLPGLSPVAGKPLTAAQDGSKLSSNGGRVVLREIAVKLDLAQVIAGPLADSRDPSRVLHTYAHMVTARMMAIADGPCRRHVFDMTDCDDLDALRENPTLKIACERAPESGAGIASQPTLSRLENLPDRRTLVEIGLGFIDLFCRSWSKPPERITLDFDDTDDPAHGQQELAIFNTHAGTTCFEPMLIFQAGSQLSVFAMMRPC
jgi:Transposase DDE domain group 1